MKRLRNAVVALVATLVAYQAYVFGVVPVIEPTLAVRPYDPASEGEWNGGFNAVQRWQKILKNYLPADHWALRGTPQVYEYAPVVLVLDDFTPTDRGEVELTKCVMLAFPTPRTADNPAPRDAILIEPPEKVSILFDRLDAGLDFSGGKVGRPIAASFPGKLVISSDMQEPGPHDDLRIETRDLQLNQALLWTPADVKLELGPHRGEGRGLEIKLFRDKHASASQNPVAGIEWLTIHEGIRATIDVRDLAQGGSPLAGEGILGPLELTAAGEFRFDFQAFRAEIDDDVRATLHRGRGVAPDRLYCRELSVAFGDAGGGSLALDAEEEPELARAQSRRLGELRPRLIEAIGSPVRLESPSRQAAVRGERVQAWVGQRRLRIEGAPATLAQGLSEAQAPILEYTAPPEGSSRVLGDLLAAGPGWMRLTPKAERPERTYEARWNALPSGREAVRLQRNSRGDPVLTILGRPQFAATGFGKLRADRVDVQLREVAADGPSGPAIELGNDGALMPLRVDATGDVDFVGQQAEGEANQLVAVFQPLEEAAPRDAGPVLDTATGSLPVGRKTRRRTSDNRYALKTNTIQVDIALTGERATPLTLLCDGGVKLTELTPAPGERPLTMQGAQLRADRLNLKGASRVTLAGGVDATGQESLAQIQARGMRVWVRDLHVDQGTGRAWTEGQGDARVVLRQRPDSPVSGGEATLRWRGGMQFDGRQLTVRDEVFAETADGWLNTAELVATLNRPVDLSSGSLGGGEPIDVAQIACSGGVTIEHRANDEQGQTAHSRVEIASLSYDRASGQLTGEGRGSLRTVRLSGGVSLPGQPAKPSKKGGLTYLRVDFRTALQGNLLERTARLRGGVEAVYGPVLAWEQQLPLRSTGDLPPESAELRCEELRILEDPAYAVSRGRSLRGDLGPVELQALREVRIESTLNEEGAAVVAEAATASYSQAADRLDLAGDGQQLARLWVRPDAAQRFVPTTAGRLTHYPSLKRTKIHEWRTTTYQPPANAARPANPTR